MPNSSSGNRSPIFIKSQVVTGLLLFSLAFIPRILNLTAYVAADEAKWILRSAYFLTALLKGDFSAAASQVATPEVDVLAPGVTTMWTGTLGLLAKYQADGASMPLVDYLAALPYARSERVSLDFYPWLRFPTVLITSLFIVAFYVLLQKLLDRRIALTASILLALDPFFLNHSRVIHHDALVTVFVTLSLLLLLVYLQQRGGRWWLSLSGVALGLAVSTKPTALILVLFAGLMYLWQAYRVRRWSLPGWGVWWAGIGLLTFILVWPALWSNPVGAFARLLQTSLAASAGDDSHQTLIPTLVPDRLPHLGILYYPISWLLRWGILPTLGLVMVPFVRRRRWQHEDTGVKSSLTWLMVFSVLLMLMIAPLGSRDIRYYLPAWPALMPLAAFGLIRFRRWMTPLVVAVLSVLLLIPYYPYYITYFNPLCAGPYLAPRLVKVGGGEGMEQVAAYLNDQPDIAQKTVVSTMLESFRPYFHGHVIEHRQDSYADIVVNYIRQIQGGSPSNEYLAYFGARVPQYTVRLDGIEYAYIYFLPSPRPVRNVSFGDVRLIAQTIDARFAQPGHVYHLTLLWKAPSAARAIVVRVQVRDLSGRVWSEGEGSLLSQDGPSAVEGHYTLALPSDMPRGDYQLWAVVGTGGNWALIGTMSVYRFAPPEAIAYPLDENFGDIIALRGFNLSNHTPTPGETVTLTLHWQALQAMPRSYTSFVHLVDPAGKLVAQNDSIPGNGKWPTDTWQAGEWVTNEVLLTLPSNLPAGEYRLLTGWYDWQTNERLPVANDASGQHVVILQAIRIE